MTLNVDFLKQFPQWKSIHESAVEAESNVYAKPRTSLFYSRVTLERAVKWLYQNDDYLRYPAKVNPTLGDLIHERTFRDNLSPGMFSPLKLIIKLGNRAVHDEAPVSGDEAKLVFQHLFMFLNWLQRYYGEPPLKGLTFDESLIPKPSAAPTRESLEELAKLEKRIAEIDAKLLEITEENRQLREELRALQRERKPKPPVVLTPENEAKTRQLLIDIMLREAGWDPHGENVREFAVEGMPNRSKLGFCDYVLWGDDGRPLAVIEAKSTVHDPEKGKQQAKLYADQLEEKYGQRPLIFYTNGYEVRFWDDKHYPPRQVATFFRKDELEWIIQQRSMRKPLRDLNPRETIAGRVYQIEAIRRVAEALEEGRRHTLLVMATGTGKTRTAIALVELLKRAGWVRNVLFLADRRELVKQAHDQFKKYLPHESLCNLLEEKGDTSARIYFSTYHTMLGLVEPKPGDPIPFGVAHFDLIIIDEAHRSIYRKFGLIFQYFDAILVGLTATPKKDVDRDTYKFFRLPENVPTFAYEYEEAVKDGYLVPVKPVEVTLKFLRHGIDKRDLSEEEREAYEQTVQKVTGKESVESDALNRWLFNRDTVAKVLRHLMEKGIKVKGGDELGKTIIFAQNQKHAEFIVKVFDELYPRYKGKFAAAVHNKVDYVDKLIEDFKDKDKYPQIAVSVDMLDTGIDVPEVVNLVMFRPVFTHTKFWQMIGRGTRLCKDLFGPGRDKTHALLFDYCGNVEFFRAFKEGRTKGHEGVSLSARLFEERTEFIYELQDRRDLQNVREAHVSYIIRQLENQDAHHFAIRPYLPLVIRYRQANNWNFIDSEEKQQLVEKLAPVVYDETSEEKKRFDLLMLRLQRAKLGTIKAKQVTALRKRLKSLAEKLLKKRNLQQIADKASLLEKILHTEFFDQTTVEELEKIRFALRDLLDLLDREQRTILYTDFTDEVMDIAEDQELPETGDLSAYREAVSEYIRKHRDHIAIQKLRKNRPITEMDVREFGEMLFAEKVGTREQFEALFGKDGSSFGIFVRSLLGLEREAAQEAFAELLSRTTLNANQIHFINMIIDYLTKNGTLEPEKLMDEPFTSIHRDGVYGLFDEDSVEEIVRIVKYVQKQAEIKTG